MSSCDFKAGPCGYSIIGVSPDDVASIEILEGSAKQIYFQNILGGNEQLADISEEDQQKFKMIIHEIRNRNEPDSLSTLFHIAVAAIGDSITWPLEIMMAERIFGTGQAEREKNSQDDDGNTMLHLITIDGSLVPNFNKELMEKFTKMVIEIFGPEVLTAMNNESLTALDIAENPEYLLKDPNDLEEKRERNTSPRFALVEAIKNAYKQAGYGEYGILRNVR